MTYTVGCGRGLSLQVDGLDSATQFRPMRATQPHTVSLGVLFERLAVTASFNATLPGGFQSQVTPPARGVAAVVAPPVR